MEAVEIVASAPVEDTRVATPADGAAAARASRAHMTRLLAFGGVSALAGGAVIALEHDDPRFLHFGIHTAIGGLSNVAFGALSLPGIDRPRSAWELARTREFMMLNIGLDAGYVAAGAAMGALGDEHPALEGAGWAIASQGLGLLVFDVIYYLSLPPALR